MVIVEVFGKEKEALLTFMKESGWEAKEQPQPVGKIGWVCQIHPQDDPVIQRVITRAKENARPRWASNSKVFTSGWATEKIGPVTIGAKVEEEAPWCPLLE